MTSQGRQITILRSGSLTLVEDGGRPGLAHLAIPPSGVLDRKAWKLANRLVGNNENAAVLETTMTGVAFRADCSCIAAVTGAPAPVQVDETASNWGAPVPLAAGQILSVGTVVSGLRCYVAVSGGIAVEPKFGSMSTDLLSGIGPPRISDGDELPLGSEVKSAPLVDLAQYEIPQDRIDLDMFLGPRHDWLTKESLAVLSTQLWTVGADSNRIGIRLEGSSPLELRHNHELVSEAMITGSVQIHPNGMPVIFLADHPTTGGYPVVGVVPQQSLDLCAQACPGTLVSFHIRPPTWNFADN